MSNEDIRRRNRRIFKEPIEFKGDVGGIRGQRREFAPTEARTIIGVAADMRFEQTRDSCICPIIFMSESESRQLCA